MSSNTKYRIQHLLSDSILGVKLSRSGDVSRRDLVTLLEKDAKVKAALDQAIQIVNGICPPEQNAQKDTVLGDLSYAIRNYNRLENTQKGSITNLIRAINDNPSFKNLKSKDRINNSIKRKMGLHPQSGFYEPKMLRGGETTIGPTSAYVPSQTGQRRQHEKQGNAIIASNLSAEQGKGELLPNHVHPDTLMENQSLPKVTSIQDASTDISSFRPTEEDKYSLSTHPVYAEKKKPSQKRKLQDTLPEKTHPEHYLNEKFPEGAEKKARIAYEFLRTAPTQQSEAPTTSALNITAYQQSAQGLGGQTTMGNAPDVTNQPLMQSGSLTLPQKILPGSTTRSNNPSPTLPTYPELKGNPNKRKLLQNPPDDIDLEYMQDNVDGIPHAITGVDRERFFDLHPEMRQPWQDFMDNQGEPQIGIAEDLEEIHQMDNGLVGHGLGGGGAAQGLGGALISGTISTDKIDPMAKMGHTLFGKLKGWLSGDVIIDKMTHLQTKEEIMNERKQRAIQAILNKNEHIIAGTDRNSPVNIVAKAGKKYIEELTSQLEIIGENAFSRWRNRKERFKNPLLEVVHNKIIHLKKEDLETGQVWEILETTKITDALPPSKKKVMDPIITEAAKKGHDAQLLYNRAARSLNEIQHTHSVRLHGQSKKTLLIEANKKLGKLYLDYIAATLYGFSVIRSATGNTGSIIDITPLNLNFLELWQVEKDIEKLIESDKKISSIEKEALLYTQKDIFENILILHIKDPEKIKQRAIVALDLFDKLKPLWKADFEGKYRPRVQDLQKYLDHTSETKLKNIDVLQEYDNLRGKNLYSEYEKHSIHDEQLFNKFSNSGKSYEEFIKENPELDDAIIRHKWLTKLSKKEKNDLDAAIQRIANSEDSSEGSENEPQPQAAPSPSPSPTQTTAPTSAATSAPAPTVTTDTISQSTTSSSSGGFMDKFLGYFSGSKTTTEAPKRNVYNQLYNAVKARLESVGINVSEDHVKFAFKELTKGTYGSTFIKDFEYATGLKITIDPNTWEVIFTGQSKSSPQAERIIEALVTNEISREQGHTSMGNSAMFVEQQLSILEGMPALNRNSGTWSADFNSAPDTTGAAGEEAATTGTAAGGAATAAVGEGGGGGGPTAAAGTSTGATTAPGTAPPSTTAPVSTYPPQRGTPTTSPEGAGGDPSQNRVTQFQAGPALQPVTENLPDTQNIGLLRPMFAEGGADIVKEINEDRSATAINRLVWQSFNTGQWEANQEPDNPLNMWTIVEDVWRFSGELDKDDCLQKQIRDAISEGYAREIHTAYNVPEYITEEAIPIIQDIIPQPEGPSDARGTDAIFHNVYLPAWTEIPDNSPWKEFTAIEGNQIPDSLIRNPFKMTGNDWPLLRSENAFIWTTLD